MWKDRGHLLVSIFAKQCRNLSWRTQLPLESKKPRPKTEDHTQEAGNKHQDVKGDTQDSEITRARSYTQVKRVSGPIPSAEEFSHYEAAYPGSAERLFLMAEREQKDFVSFRAKALLSATTVAIVTIVAIAYILTANPNGLILLALAIAHILPPIMDFIRGVVDTALSRRERELELQIRKDNHELDMLAARERLQLTPSAEEPITQRARRLESGDESTETQESN